MTIGIKRSGGGSGKGTDAARGRRHLRVRKRVEGTPERGSGIRHYGPDDVRRLRFIRQPQAAGFTLQEIRELLELDAGEDRNRARELAKARVEALDAKIADLQRTRDALRRLASACAEGSTGPCPILTSFDV